MSEFESKDEAAGVRRSDDDAIRAVRRGEDDKDVEGHRFYEANDAIRRVGRDDDEPEVEGHGKR